MRYAPDEKRLTRIHELEIKRHNLLHRTELLHRDEEARRVTVGWLSLKDENSTLQDELQQTHLERNELKEGYDSLIEQLNTAHETARKHEAKFKLQQGELGRLQAEVEHMGSSMQDSGKLMQEKLSLTRELDRLRPELEHLQSQLTNHQAVVAEKHRLQRQLDSVEVELDNEKRARHRAQDKENKALTDELKAKAEHAQKCLTSERKEREKLKRDHEAALSEATGLSEQLEGKLSDVKANLLKTQAELKTAKAELDRRQANPVVMPAAATRATSLAPSRSRSNKRRSDESHLQEVTFETPGNDSHSERHIGKKRGGKYAPVGEKSSFSVTPFLNRNKNPASESHGFKPPIATSVSLPEQSEPPHDMVQGEASHISESFENAETTLAQPGAAASSKAQKPQRQRGRPKASQLNKTSSSTRHNANLAAGSSAGDGHDQAEDRSDEDVADQEGSTKAAGQQDHTQQKMLKREGQKFGLGPHTRDNTAEADGKKKRRKLLGAGKATLFDDDGEEEPISTQNRVGQGAKRKKAPLGGLSNAFASTSFSPLKRDRRGVGASFLA